MTTTAAIVATIAILLALFVASYVTIVSDIVIARAMGARPIRAAEAMVRPARIAALLMLQQVVRTERPDAALWTFAPALLGATAAGMLGVLAVAPIGALPSIEGGIVYLGALMVIAMVAYYLHGWSANSLFPLIGGYRFIALALSYEMPLVLVLIAAALPAESLDIAVIVDSQRGMWNAVRQPLGLPLYMVAALGLASRGPMDLADAEDLVRGTASDVSGARLVAWRFARFAILVAVCAIGAAVFLGGWLGPWLPPLVWLAIKTYALIVLLLAVSHTIGRVRLERFVVVAWTVLIPLALVHVFASGLFVLAARS